MKNVYFVTEGPTDQIVLEGLIALWLGEDFVPRRIQPPDSAYAADLDSNLSDGWKGVVAWCGGKRLDGTAGRDEALQRADCLVIHVDADIASDPAFRTPAFAGPCPPAAIAANWVRNHLTALFGGVLPPRVVFCVPAQDLEAWVLCSLHPDIADSNMPIECRAVPAALLVQRLPHKLVRSKGGKLKKLTRRYGESLASIVRGWPNCVEGTPPRCNEALRFEQEVRAVLGVSK